MIGILRLAARNLSRNRRRTLATLLAIALGSTAVLLFGGFAANIKLSLQTGYVRTVGHLQIQHRDFYEFGSGDPARYGIRQADDLMQRLRSDPVLGPLTRVATPTLQFGGVAGNYAAGVSRTVMATGLVADDHVRMREWNPFDLELKAPPMRLQDTGRDAAVLGVGLARVLLLCDALGLSNCPSPDAKDPAGATAARLPSDIAALGDLAAEGSPGAGTKPGQATRTVELLTTSARGAPNVATLQAVHAENQGFKELDEVFVMMHLAQAQRLVFSTSEPKVSAILVQLHASSQLDAAMQRLAEVLPQWSTGQPLVARDFASLNPFYPQSIALFDTIFGFMFALIGCIAMFTVANTMNTAVVERTVEIGTLRAIGLRRRGIQGVFVAEGALIGVAGAAAGILCALTAAALVNASGITWRPPASAESVPLTLKVWGQPGLLWGTACGLVVLTVVSAWWPAFRASRLNMVEALRHA